MEEYNLDYFKEFKEYLSSNNYEVDEISECSVRGIKGDEKFHFFYDYKYYEYCMYINIDGRKRWATMFDVNNDGFILNDEKDNREFKDLEEVILFTVDNSSNK